LNREGTSEFSDRQAPATMEIPADVRSVEIRHTGGGGTLDLKVQNSKGPAMVSLMKSNDYADLFITKTAILWSQNTKTVSQLKR
jgi:hypothetical protein